ncbi:unnamed protein product [Haemonchus placei]|uniref:Nuclear receptor domain-containing protein n=1 Tax=Haemonchus placei TaxID=6290 RepID=A0A0N4W8C0_HAEPC|nr:unnamed protein product [Haemonchus placei]
MSCKKCRFDKCIASHMKPECKYAFTSMPIYSLECEFVEFFFSLSYSDSFTTCQNPINGGILENNLETLRSIDKLLLEKGL